MARHAELYSDLYKRIHAAVSSGNLDHIVFDVPPAIGDRDELYLSHALIELMHRVFIDLKLDTFAERPHNAGWMSIFQHWYGKPAVRDTWSRVGSTYSRRFRSFVDRLPQWKRE